MRSRPIFIAAIGSALLALPAMAQAPAPAAAAWRVDEVRSRLGFTGIAEEKPFSGRFGKWDAQINFDPEDLAHSAALVTVDIASVSTGDDTRDNSLVDGDWFAAAMFPEATFASDTISATGDGQYVAEGTLTIRDVSLPVSLPFELQIDGDVAKMSGGLTIDREAFGLGTKSWQTGYVSGEIEVAVSVTATRAE